jgi:hypothetical protein
MKRNTRQFGCKSATSTSTITSTSTSTTCTGILTGIAVLLPLMQNLRIAFQSPPSPRPELGNLPPLHQIISKRKISSTTPLERYAFMATGNGLEGSPLVTRVLDFPTIMRIKSWSLTARTRGRSRLCTFNNWKLGSDILKGGRHWIPQDGRYIYLGDALLSDEDDRYAYLLLPCPAYGVSYRRGVDSGGRIGPCLLDGGNKFQNGIVARFRWFVPCGLVSHSVRAVGVLRIVPGKEPAGGKKDDLV